MAEMWIGFDKVAAKNAVASVALRCWGKRDVDLHSDV